jgi:REP element-mobilizing transposase RayT
MRQARIKEPLGGYYHLLSRVVDKKDIFTATEKERFRRLMRRAEAFSGVDILTYCCMDNHWHILLHVPPSRPLSDPELLRRLGHLYERGMVEEIGRQLRTLRGEGREEAAERLKQRYTRRMHDLSEFGKTLKQRFTQSYNRRHGRKGTLWEERFKSILVEGSGHALSTIAAYIELNPVRAGLVEDPGDYRFSGYGEALAGREEARRSIQRLMVQMDQPQDWAKVARSYRRLLYAWKARRPGGGRAPAGALPTAEKDIDLTPAALLRCRVRYFIDGGILGSRLFVEEAVARHRQRCGARPPRAPCPIPPGGPGEGLCTAHRLRTSATAAGGSA